MVKIERGLRQAMNCPQRRQVVKSADMSHKYMCKGVIHVV